MELEGAFFDTDQFDLTSKMLGEGSFGKVYIVTSKKDKTKFAAKIIDPAKLNSGKDQMMLFRESEILHKLHHPAIVKFYGINFHSFDDPSKLSPTILTEFLSNGSLKEILDKEKQSIANADWTPTKKYICLLGISDAMRYLHGQHIIHRDLKPQNVLIDSKFYPRVCDFGLSRCFSESLSQSMQISMTGHIGTPLYMAPELCEDDSAEMQKYGPKIDVYSFAILAYEIVTGIEPFSNNGKSISLMQLTRKLSAGDRPEFNRGVTSQMKELIQKCWSNDPKDRPTFEEIFEKLSNDLSYFEEDVDEDEINEYLQDLEEARRKEEEEAKAKSKGNEEKEEKRKETKESNNTAILSDFIIDNEDLKIDKKIDHGSYGIVYKAKLRVPPWTDGAEISCAVKKLLRVNELYDLKSFFNEIQIQASLNHISVLPLIGYCTPLKENDQYMVVIPYMPNGSLHNFIQKARNGNTPPNTETIRAICIFGIAAGMAYIHQHDVLRRDLKPRDILLDDNYHPKICDFGIAIHLKQGLYLEAEITGTPLYMSPEALKGDAISHKTDVYSYSISLYELLTFNVAYEERMFSASEVAYGRLRPKIVDGKIPPIFANLLRRCWDQDPEKRPSFIQIVKEFLDRKEEYFNFTLINEDEFNDYIEESIKGLNFD